MSPAITNALSGLQAASFRFSNAAQAIAQPVADTGPQQTIPAPERPAGNVQLASETRATSLVENVADLKLAELSYKANAKVLGLIADTEESLLDILS